MEKIGRLALKAGKILRESGVDQLLKTTTEKKQKLPASVKEVWEKYCDARAHHFRTKHHLSDSHKVTQPALTNQRVKLISDAVKRHGVERVKRAAIGLFLSKWHSGFNEHGKEYLEPERPFQIKQGKDYVDYFADIYTEEHGEF
jgi:hypothetical protein